MRILHTADWHLGATLERASRLEDHTHFLDWLVATIVERGVELLIVAGDIYDRSQPSNEAQEQYYGFFARLYRLERPPQVIIIAGNHDSPSFIDAPAALLRHLRVSVTGSLGRTEAEWPDCLVPIAGLDGETALVVAAVPFVHQYHLGISLADQGAAEAHAAFADRVRHLHETLGQAAEQRWPGVPRVAVGHWSIGAWKAGDAPREVHAVGTINGLEPSVFAGGWSYVALGHIHRPYPVAAQPPMRYAGSPVALSFDEAKTPRRVTLVDLALDGEVSVESLDVPVWRDLVKLSGPPDEVLDALRALRSTRPLATLVMAEAQVDAPRPGWAAEVADLLAAHPEPRPLLVAAPVRLLRAGDSSAAAQAEPDTMTPEWLFGVLYEATHGSPPSPAVAAAFARIAADEVTP